MATKTHAERMAAAELFYQRLHGLPVVLSGLSQDIVAVQNNVNNLDSLYSTDVERVAAINDLAGVLSAAIESGDTTVAGTINAAITQEQALRNQAIADALVLNEQTQATALTGIVTRIDNIDAEIETLMYGNPA